MGQGVAESWAHTATLDSHSNKGFQAELKRGRWCLIRRQHQRGPLDNIILQLIAAGIHAFGRDRRTLMPGPRRSRNAGAAFAGAALPPWDRGILPSAFRFLQPGRTCRVLSGFCYKAEPAPTFRLLLPGGICTESAGSPYRYVHLRNVQMPVTAAQSVVGCILAERCAPYTGFLKTSQIRGLVCPIWPCSFCPC